MLSTRENARCMQDFAFFYLHRAEQFKVNSGPLSLAALGHSKCQSRSSQKAQASFSACFKSMPRWVNWKRVVLSSDPMSNTMSFLQLPGLVDLLACYCSRAAEMLSSHQHSVLRINSHQWRKTVTCPMDCFFKLYSSASMPWSVLHLLL